MVQYKSGIDIDIGAEVGGGGGIEGNISAVL